MPTPVIGLANVERLYARALRLYPQAFRNQYAKPMQQALRDTLADRAVAPHTLLRVLIRDLITSLVKEHCAMLRDTFGRPALIFNALVLSGIATLLGLALYAIPQQVLRQGADDPQIQMATDTATFLERYGITDGLLHGALVKSDTGIVDLKRSLSPFLIVYNDKGLPLGSNAQLDGQTPTPPAGVFDYVRAHGEERVSWQPILGNSRGLRIAAVVERVNGTQPGFVLAGRSMREVQARIDHIQTMAGMTWLGMLCLIGAGTIAYAWYTRPKTTSTTLNSTRV
jgi:hypothetical protein